MWLDWYAIQEHTAIAKGHKIQGSKGWGYKEQHRTRAKFVSTSISSSFRLKFKSCLQDNFKIIALQLSQGGGKAE